MHDINPKLKCENTTKIKKKSQHNNYKKQFNDINKNIKIYKHIYSSFSRRELLNCRWLSSMKKAVLGPKLQSRDNIGEETADEKTHS